MLVVVGATGGGGVSHSLFQLKRIKEPEGLQACKATAEKNFAK